MSNELQKTESNQIQKFSLVPQNLQQAIDAANRFAKSGMVPKTYENKPDAILVAWELGNSLGLGLMQSLQAIAVINGMPTIWGDSALAIVMDSKQLEDIDESTEGVCILKRKGRKPVTTTFTMEDAKKAGLTTKPGPWTQYPKRMLQMRVRGFALRDVFTDVLKGFKIAEEVQDYVSPYPDAINATAKPFESILTPAVNNNAVDPEKTKADPEPKTNQETGEIVQEASNAPMTTDEMNQRLLLIDEITNLRSTKAVIIKAQFPATNLDILDKNIENMFDGVSLPDLIIRRDFIAGLK